jgi:hypothetical protein
MGIFGHFHIGQLSVTELDVDVVANLAVSGKIGWRLVGGDGKDLKLPPQDGGEKAVEGLPGVRGIPGEDGFKDVVVADIGDVGVVGKLDCFHKISCPIYGPEMCGASYF